MAILRMLHDQARNRAGNVHQDGVIGIGVRTGIVLVVVDHLVAADTVFVGQGQVRAAFGRNVHRQLLVREVVGVDLDLGVGVDVVDPEGNILDFGREGPLVLAEITVVFSARRHGGVFVRRSAVGGDRVHFLVVGFEHRGGVVAGRGHGEGHVDRPGVQVAAIGGQVVLIVDGASAVRIVQLVPFKDFAPAGAGRRALGAIVAVHQVGPFAAVQAIVTGIAVHGVVAGAANKRVVANWAVFARTGVFQRVEIDVGDVHARRVMAFLLMRDDHLGDRAGDIDQNGVIGIGIRVVIVAVVVDHFLAGNAVLVGQRQVGAAFRPDVDRHQVVVRIISFDRHLRVSVDVVDTEGNIANLRRERPLVGNRLVIRVQAGFEGRILVRFGPVGRDRVDLLLFGLELGLGVAGRADDREADIHGTGVLREAAGQIVAVVDGAGAIGIGRLVPFEAFALAGTAGGPVQVTVVAEHQVVAFAAFQAVVAGIAVQGVVALLTFQSVIFAIAEDLVVAEAAFDHVLAGRATFDAGIIVGRAGDGTRGRASTGRITKDHVVAGTCVDGVVVAATINFVVAAAGMDDVVASATDHDVLITRLARQDGIVAVHLVVVGIDVVDAHGVIARRPFHIAVAAISRGRLVFAPPVPKKDTSHKFSPSMSVRTIGRSIRCCGPVRAPRHRLQSIAMYRDLCAGPQA